MAGASREPRRTASWVASNDAKARIGEEGNCQRGDRGRWRLRGACVKVKADGDTDGAL